MNLPTLSEAEEKLITIALSKTEGNRTKAARILGIDIRTIRRKIHTRRKEHNGNFTEDKETDD